MELEWWIRRLINLWHHCFLFFDFKYSNFWLAIIVSCSIITICHHHHHHHHHIRLFEVVKRNRQHTVEKIDVGIYMDIHTIHAG